MLSHFSHIQLFAILCTVAYQAPWSMVFSRQEYCSGLPCPHPGHLPHPGIKLVPLVLSRPVEIKWNLIFLFFLDINWLCTMLKSLSRVQLFVTPWTVATKFLCPWGFSRQEYWSGLSCPPSGDLPNPGTELLSPAFTGVFFTTEPPGKPPS